MKRGIYDIYYDELGSCEPMTPAEEKERAASIARLRDERDRLERKPRARRDVARLAEVQTALDRERRAFAKANLRLVVKIASRYQKSSLSLTDLIQEGNVGLMIALDKFDHARGVRFCTYAAWWIRHCILRALSNHGRAVQLPSHIAQDARKLTKITRGLEARLGRTPTAEELARAADMPAQRVALIRRATSNCVSLDAPRGEDESSRLRDMLPDATASSLERLSTEQTEAQVRAALETLTPIEADILRKRFSFDGEEPLTLRELGSRHSLSRERVRQLQNGALRKLRDTLASHAAA